MPPVRVVALLAAVTLGAVVPQLHASVPMPATAVANDTAPEPVVIDLRIGRIAGTTVQAYRVRSEVLLPMSQFFQLAEIRHRLTPDGRLEATIDPGNRRIVIDIRSDTMQYGDHRVPIESEFIRFESSELYVVSERLGDLLGVMFPVDLSVLTETVCDTNRHTTVRRVPRKTASLAVHR